MNTIRREESDILTDLYRRYGSEVPYESDRGVRTRTKSFEVWLAEENKQLRDELAIAKNAISERDNRSDADPLGSRDSGR